MKVLLGTSLLLALVAFGAASIAQGNFSDPEHPGKCAIKPTFIVEPGTHQNPDVCGRILCSSNGWATFHYCGAKRIFIPGCTLGDFVDKSVGYPDCCSQKLVCPDNPEYDGQLF